MKMMRFLVYPHFSKYGVDSEMIENAVSIRNVWKDICSIRGPKQALKKIYLGEKLIHTK